MNEVANGWIWFGFTLFVIFALTIDALVHQKKNMHPHESVRVAGFWVLVWISCALIFNLLLWYYLHTTVSPAFAHETALNFFTGYLIETSLSIDNLFMFYLVFTQLRIPAIYQQRVFSYGIWSAIIMRLLFILLGSWLVSHFHWVLYLMGVFLLITGIKLFFSEEKHKDLADMLVMRMIKKLFRVTHEIHENHFFIRKNHLLYATPLFVALIFIEMSDLIFALDSIPAIFAITRDPFIVWTSNIFAILGLRSMYFVLAKMVDRFHLLKYGISLILIFVGTKMVVAPWYEIPVVLSLSIVMIILVLFTILSLTRRQV